MSDGPYTNKCGCFDGYTLEERTNCIDVNECEINNGGCSHDCVNLNGTSFCSCPNGYRLSTPTTCEKINECLEGNGNCEHNCVDTSPYHYCTCRPGYELINGKECEDINECELYGANGGCSDTCVNTDGSYECICPQDKQYLGADNKTCVSSDGEQLGPGFVPQDPNLLPESAPVRMREGDDEENSLGIGAIIGGVLGGLALLLLILLLLMLLYRRRRGNWLWEDLYHNADPPPAYEYPGPGGNAAADYMDPISGLPIVAPIKKGLDKEKEAGASAFQNNTYVEPDEKIVPGKKEVDEPKDYSEMEPRDQEENAYENMAFHDPDYQDTGIYDDVSILRKPPTPPKPQTSSADIDAPAATPSAPPVTPPGTLPAGQEDVRLSSYLQDVRNNLRKTRKENEYVDPPTRD